MITDFDFNKAMSDWIISPRISTIMDFGPWWYFETNPKDNDLVMAELAEKMLRAGLVRRESWLGAGELVTRYKPTKAGRDAMKTYKKALDKKFAKIMKEVWDE